MTENLEGYNTDWMNTVRGQSQLVLRPQNTDQVSKILSYCNENNLAVVPQGGNTGLVGGSNPVFDEIILSTSLMNKIEKVDNVSGIVVAQVNLDISVRYTELSGRLCIRPAK